MVIGVGIIFGGDGRILTPLPITDPNYNRAPLAVSNANTRAGSAVTQNVDPTVGDVP